MPTTQNEREDTLALAGISVLRVLIQRLHEEGVIDIASFLSALNAMIADHRKRGDPHEIATAVETISQHIRKSTSSSPKNRRGGRNVTMKR